jgi:hypothetical protein
VACYNSYTVPLVYTHLYSSMIYYTHQHVCPDVSSDETDDRITYYIYQSGMAAPFCVSADASSDYPEN